jgi:hypothetical protein
MGCESGRRDSNLRPWSPRPALISERCTSSIWSGFVGKWLEGALVPPCWKALESKAAEWNSGDLVRPEVHNRQPSQFVVDEISKSGKICGEVLPDALHRHAYVRTRGVKPTQPGYPESLSNPGRFSTLACDTERPPALSDREEVQTVERALSL